MSVVNVPTSENLFIVVELIERVKGAIVPSKAVNSVVRQKSELVLPPALLHPFNLA